MTYGLSDMLMHLIQKLAEIPGPVERNLHFILNEILKTNLMI